MPGSAESQDKVMRSNPEELKVGHLASCLEGKEVE